MNVEELKSYYKNNYSAMIIENYIEIEKFNQKINEKIYNFVIKAKELEEVSNNDYEIQKSLEMNKIFFRGYILESNISITLEKLNKTNYTMEQLKNIMKEYEAKNLNEYLYPYYLAFDLYDMVDEIEEIIDNKIDFEINLFKNINIQTDKIFDIKKEEYETYYNEIKNKLKSDLLDKKIIDNKIYNLCTQILNDIFNYYVNGYSNIPDTYLNNNTII